jgi:hypothetical protein
MAVDLRGAHRAQDLVGWGLHDAAAIVDAYVRNGKLPPGQDAAALTEAVRAWAATWQQREDD